MGSFKYNGISSKDLGLVIQTPPTYEFPERDVSTTHVPGRNGDLIIDNNCYKNVNRTYSIAKAFDRGTNYYANSETILKWLQSGKGKYVRLEDSYDSEVYRLATFSSNGSFTNYFDKAEAISITFECKPQRFFTIGEKPVKYTGDESYIINEYGYTTKPKVTINNIPDVLYEGITLMLTIKDENEITSSITLSKTSGTVIFDSEEESVLDDKGNDINDYVGLNGKGFPKLNAGKNTFLFETYEQERSILSPYTTIIAENQRVTTIKYTPYTVLEEMNQLKIRVIAFDDLKAKYQDSYYASSVQTYINEKCSEYTFTSFNTILSSNCETLSFTGTAESNWDRDPETGKIYADTWLEVEDHNEDGKDTIKLIARVNGYYMCTNTDKKISYKTEGQTIAEGIAVSSVITVNYYGNLDLKYDDKPEWLGFRVNFDNNNNSPESITYIGTGTTDEHEEKHGGYYWTDKTWIFGKAAWNFVEPKDLPIDFNTLKWSTSKKAFVGSTGILSTSTTATFTYRYIKELPQYEDITETVVTDDGKKITTVKAKCRFTIKDNGTKLESFVVTIKPGNSGYYAVALNDGDATAYSEVKESQALMTDLKGTDAFEIFYLEDVPTYENEDGWMDQDVFNPVKIVHAGKGSDITPQEFTFKVLKDGFYRYSYIANDGSEQYVDWMPLKANDELPMAKKPNEAFDICYIEKIPETYDFDRAYDNTKEVPDFINVTYYKNNELAEEITKEQYDVMDIDEKAQVTIKYTVAKAGYFKWDSNNTWMRKEVGDDILICNIKDDATIYYLESIPQYKDYELKDLFHMDIATDSGGNPNQVSYIIDQAGYYKYNNTTDWKYYNEKDVMLVASIGSSNTIYHLRKLDEKLDDIELIVIPRWWSL